MKNICGTELLAAFQAAIVTLGYFPRALPWAVAIPALRAAVHQLGCCNFSPSGLEEFCFLRIRFDEAVAV